MLNKNITEIDILLNPCTAKKLEQPFVNSSNRHFVFMTITPINVEYTFLDLTSLLYKSFINIFNLFLRIYFSF